MRPITRLQFLALAHPWRLLWPTALLIAACAGPGQSSPSSETCLKAPPSNWASMHSTEFAAFVRGLEQPLWDSAARQDLLEASLGFGERALRATLLCAHEGARDDAPRISEHFLASLERRKAPPSRGEGGNQITQAAALQLRPLTPEQSVRLLALVTGSDPHPDLAVRVECGCTLLALKETRVTPFLIRVLRARTPAEKTDAPDWARIDTLAWVKHRASRSLAEYLGVPDTFRPDGSWQHQIDEALKYERLLVETVGGGR